VPQILAAGAVVSRKGPQVLLVHRPKYDDWSFPKGKLDPDEHCTTAAVREVAEETGLAIRLGPPLSTQSYEVGNGMPSTKVVSYWAGRVVGDDDVSTYAPNDEIDAVRWVPLDKGRELLTYPYDRATLDEFATVRKKTSPVIVLRHAKALPRESWDGDDHERPLSELGEEQSGRLVPILGAYGVQRVVSSSSRRCWTTLAPYTDTAGLDLEVGDGLSEEEATPASVAEHVHRLLDRRDPAVLCTHRPVLPWVFEALGLEHRKLEPAGMLVVHHRRGRVVATEEH
jgi:8-oxo-dGTP pyrophosphatase MutT (NUDIX family)